MEAVIPAAVSALEDPEPREFQGGLRMAVTAANEEAQRHVVAGLNHLHGGWEFEASRHFAAALKKDPECLLAHWGMAITLMSPNPETATQRDAAVDRMLWLVDRGVGNELERGYAFGLIQYFRQGSKMAADTFRKLAERFPNDLQSGMFTALFGRGGYDEFGGATPDQERAEKLLLDLIAKHPDSTLLLNALLTIRAEAPDLGPSLESARKLTRLAPDYAPYFQVLGHYEWRTGHHAEAVAAFTRSASLYEQWMKREKVSAMDCPGWVVAECYRAVALSSKGDFETALAAAGSVSSIKVPLDRAASAGGRMVLWEAKTLPARLLMRRGQKGDAKKGLDSLPPSKEVATYREKTLAGWFIDALRIDLEALRLMEEGEYVQAAAAADALGNHGARMTTVQSAAAVGGERSAWIRGFRATETLASELRGRLALAGPKTGHPAAYNWFRSAADRQGRATMFLPPAVLVPMGVRLGDYELAVNKPVRAVSAYREALAAFPNDMMALKGLLAASEKAALVKPDPDLPAEESGADVDWKAEVEKTRKEIEAISAQ